MIRQILDFNGSQKLKRKSGLEAYKQRSAHVCSMRDMKSGPLHLPQPPASGVPEAASTEFQKDSVGARKKKQQIGESSSS